MGGCPLNIPGWSDSLNGPLNLTRITGIWKNIYDEKEKESHHCPTLKLHQLDEKNSTRIQVF